MVQFLCRFKKTTSSICLSVCPLVCLSPSAQMQCAPKSEVILPCDAHSPGDVMEPTLYYISWTFNHNQTILSRQAGEEKVVEAEWQQHVRNLSDSGSLLLYVSSSHEGTYRCTRRYTDRADVTHIKLKILEEPIQGRLLVVIQKQCVMLKYPWFEKATSGLQYFDCVNVHCLFLLHFSLG